MISTRQRYSDLIQFRIKVFKALFPPNLKVLFSIESRLYLQSSTKSIKMRFLLLLLAVPAAIAAATEAESPVDSPLEERSLERRACVYNGCKCDTSNRFRKPQGQFCGGCKCMFSPPPPFFFFLISRVGLLTLHQ